MKKQINNKKEREIEEQVKDEKREDQGIGVKKKMKNRRGISNER